MKPDMGKFMRETREKARADYGYPNGDVDFEDHVDAIYNAITDPEARYSSEMQEITKRIIFDWLWNDGKPHELGSTA